MTKGYSELLDRIQEEMDVNEITPDRIASFLAGHDTRGKTLDRRRLGSILAKTITKERQIALSFTRIESFAQEKNIKLSEKIIGKEENWKGKKVLTIRKNGRFIAWKKI